MTPPAAAVGCPGYGYGKPALARNPVPHTETENAIRVHFRDWVMRGVTKVSASRKLRNRKLRSMR
jgi:hypothetical protein